MSRHLKLIGAIVSLIEDHGPMDTADMAERLGYKRSVLRRRMDYWIKKGLFDIDKSNGHDHVFSLREGAVQALLIERPERSPAPAVIQVHSTFRMPDHLRGPVLSPLAWSMRHLLGASC